MNILCKKLSEKKAGVVIIVMLCLLLVYPVILCIILDTSALYITYSNLKTSLNASVKSASSRIDWSLTHAGTFYIDTTTPGVYKNAYSTFNHIFARNFNVNQSAFNYMGPGHYNIVNSDGTALEFFVSVYNGTTPALYPNIGSIPTTITNKNIQVQANQPTVFAIAKVEYKVFPVISLATGNEKINLVISASSQLTR